MAEGKKRYELKVYSNYTAMDSLSTPFDYVERAGILGLSGIALTDRMTVSGLCDLCYAARSSSVRAIYGAELVVENDLLPDFHKRFCVSVLAKNAAGMREINRLLSISSRQKSECVPLSELLASRDDLLLGSCCNQGAFFHYKKGKISADRFFEAAGIFDYLEISPEMDEDITRIITMIGAHYGFPVAAVSDARYCARVQSEHYRALCSANMLHAVDTPDKPLYSAAQLMQHFAYLGEDCCADVVYHAPAKIVSQIEDFEPLPLCKGTLAPHTAPLAETLRDAFAEKFGEEPPEFAKVRFDAELTYFAESGLMPDLQTLCGILSDHPSGSAYLSSTYGGTLLAYLLGFSRIDPLPGYLHCTDCGSYTQLSGQNARNTQRQIACPHCGRSCRVQGYDLPFSDFADSCDHNRLYAVCANTSEVKTFERLNQLFDREQFARIGTFRNMPFARFRKFYKSLSRDNHDCLPPLPREESFDRLSMLGGGVGLFADGQIQYLLTPQEMAVQDVTAICREPGSSATYLTAYGVEDFEAGGYPVLRLIPSDALRQLTLLEQQSDCVITEDTPYIEEALSYLHRMKEDDFGWLPEEYWGYLLRIIDDYPITGYEQLIRALSLGHGSRLWVQNFDRLVDEGMVKPNEIFTCREELLSYLLAGGVDRETAIRITDAVQHGNGDLALDEQTENLLWDLKFPHWLVPVLCEIRRLDTRVFAIAEADVLCRLLWYRLHDEKLYQKICMKGRV